MRSRAIEIAAGLALGLVLFMAALAGAVALARAAGPELAPARTSAEAVR